jgi:preprotein translocase subunit YajC
MLRILSSFVLTLIASVALFAAESGGPESAPVTAPAGAPGTPAHAPASDPFGGSGMIIMLALAFGFMYLVVIRPQKKEEKKRQELISTMKAGHKVITIGGVHGEVVSVGETTVDIKVGQSENPVVMTFNKAAVSTNVTAAAANAPAK